LGGSLQSKAKAKGEMPSEIMIMNSLTINIQTLLSRLATVVLAATTFASTTLATDQRAPEVPTTIAVEAGHRVSFHAYAEGVQIYICVQNPTDPTKFSWVLKAPEAVLFDNDGNVVGLHYGGPTWESNSGSVVVGVRVSGINMDPTAIDWLLLRAGDTDGPGIFNRTTFIHRVNTVGGRAPAVATADDFGKELRVPYTAEYFFYRVEH
jgi:hypothetical protein